MAYWIPADLTLDGQGLPGNPFLSSVDKEYVRKWYPYPTDSTGQLRTGDDCDEIDFKVDYNAVEPDIISFLLRSGSNVTWWKSIKIPIASSDYVEIEIANGGSSERSIRKLDIDTSRPIRFSKAKFLGVHTQLGYSWDVLQALIGGTRITLTWNRDRCK